MRVKPIIDVLSRAREKYISKHGIEPHVYKSNTPNTIILCAGTQKDTFGVMRTKAPIERIESRYIAKALQAIK